MSIIKGRVERYLDQDVYLFFLINGLAVDLLPELIPLIRHAVFAPYSIEGILDRPEDDAVRPITLAWHSLLPDELKSSDFVLTLDRWSMIISRSTIYGLIVSMRLHNKPTPLVCHWDTIEETPLKYIVKCMIQNANEYLEVTRSGVMLNY